MFLRLLLIFFYLIFTFDNLSGQNLVINPSFEEYWIPQTYPVIADTFYIKDWSNVYMSYPSRIAFYLKGNYNRYNNGKIFNLFNIPDNSFGFHPAHSGNAYVGIIPYSMEGYTEFLTGKLISPLNKGKKYKVSFYIKYAGNKCALYFTKLEITFALNSDFSQTKSISPYYCPEKESTYQNIFSKRKTYTDITFNDIPLLQDTSGWIKLTNMYVAQGGEKFFTIGLFYQGEEISNRMRKMALRYTKVWDNPKRREHLLKTIDKFNIPFIKYNPNYRIENWIKTDGKSKTILMMVDAGYYFLDDVSIEEMKE